MGSGRAGEEEEGVGGRGKGGEGRTGRQVSFGEDEEGSSMLARKGHERRPFRSSESIDVDV